MDKYYSLEDETLVSLAQAEDSKAFNCLLERHQHKIRQIILFSINDPAQVNDISQEVLLKVYRYLHSFNVKCRFSTWLYRIIQNTIKNHYRVLNQQQDCESQFIGELHSQGSHSPEYLVINHEYNEKVVLAIAKLSEDLRICYGMHTFEGHTYEEIAKKMCCPIGTVRSRISRARKLLFNTINK